MHLVNGIECGSYYVYGAHGVPAGGTFALCASSSQQFRGHSGILAPFSRHRVLHAIV